MEIYCQKINYQTLNLNIRASTWRYESSFITKYRFYFFLAAPEIFGKKSFNHLNLMVFLFEYYDEWI